jgi:hypothetical protein
MDREGGSGGWSPISQSPCEQFRAALGTPASGSALSETARDLPGTDENYRKRSLQSVARQDSPTDASTCCSPSSCSPNQCWRYLAQRRRGSDGLYARVGGGRATDGAGAGTAGEARSVSRSASGAAVAAVGACHAKGRKVESALRRICVELVATLLVFRISEVKEIVARAEVPSDGCDDWE